MNTLAEWFEKDFLQFQLEFGRSSLKKYAEHIQLSQGYVSQLMAGKRTTVSLSKSKEIAEIRHDPTILDIQGYARSDSQNITIDSLPRKLRERLSFALEEIETTLRTQSIQPDSREGINISSAILKKYGFIVSENNDSE
ncbi:MAG: hypothetical protein ABFD14_01305 [Anaerolineaceae bacterium]